MSRTKRTYKELALEFKRTKSEESHLLSFMKK